MDPVLLLLLPAAFLAGATQAIVGFAFGMITMALLPLGLPVTVAVAVVAVLGLLVNVLVLWRWRAHVQARRVLPLAAGGALGAPFGIAFLAGADGTVVKATLGGVLVLYGTLTLGRELRAAPSRDEAVISRHWAWPAGLLGGMFGAAFNVGGPPAIVYATMRRWSPGAFRANLQAFFTVVTLFQLALLAQRGLLARESLQLAAWALPAVLLGVGTGFLVARKLDAPRFRRLVLAFLIALGLVYVAQGALAV